VPPGEAAYNCAVLNTMLAREGFSKAAGAAHGDGFPLPMPDSPDADSNGN
jgi:Ras-related GTP-binding protein A/B